MEFIEQKSVSFRRAIRLKMLILDLDETLIGQCDKKSADLIIRNI